MPWSVYTKSYHCPIVVSPRFRLNHQRVFDRFKEKDHTVWFPQQIFIKVPTMWLLQNVGTRYHFLWPFRKLEPQSLCLPLCNSMGLPLKNTHHFNIQIVINWVINVYLVHPFCNIHSNYNNIIIHNGGFYASTFWYYEVLFDPVN